MLARFGVIGALAIWLFPAASAVELGGCNDGSTGCCFVCPECACGNMCVSCSFKCTSPKGCYCGSTTEESHAALASPPDAGGGD